MDYSVCKKDNQIRSTDQKKQEDTKEMSSVEV